eukprot:Nitzschia sp. Nitz4//scaffold3_size479765//129602//131054//NITZ4_000056-RA/size479765-snap-gene-0.122-mRNA-1//1//CDS//3329550626//7469//frame0
MLRCLHPRGLTTKYETRSTFDLASYLPSNRNAGVGDATRSFLNEELEASLQSYNPSRYPVLPNFDVSNLPIRVGIVTVNPPAGESKHFFVDGAINSVILDFVGAVALHNTARGHENNESTAETIYSVIPVLKPGDVDVWVVDYLRVGDYKRDFLDALLFTENATWKVLLIDYSDYYYEMEDERILSQPHVRMAFRSIVDERYFDHNLTLNATIIPMDIPVIDPGYVIENAGTATAPILHTPYAVRSDIVSVMEEERKLRLKKSGFPATIDVTDPEWERPFDVVHLWNILDPTPNGNFRNCVTKVLMNWNGTRTHKDGQFWRVSTSQQGPRYEAGRSNANLPYVNALFSTKIVVVAQRDEWEDHYRLFESLASGALVVHDKMLAPPKGLQHGVNILFFETFRELEELLTYYLENTEERIQVARRGRELAFGRHRSWHRIEELIFGRPYTNVSKEFAEL